MNNIDPALFEEWMMTGLVTILIIFMGFIVWDLAKKSKAGRFGSFILFLCWAWAWQRSSSKAW